MSPAVVSEQCWHGLEKFTVMILEKQPISLQFNSGPCSCGMDGESGLLSHTSSVTRLMKSSDFRERTPWSVNVCYHLQKKSGEEAGERRRT